MSRAFAVAGSASFFLPFFPRVWGTFEQVPAFMSRQPSLLGRAERSSPQRPQGLRHQAQGLDGASARQQQLVIGLMASERILSTFVRLLSLMLEVEVPYSNLIQGWSPLFERMRRSPHHLISGPGSILVPRSLIRTVRGHRAPRRMGPIFTPAFFSHGFRRPHIHLGSVMSILSANPVAVP